jgi:uncharacterized membrane protein
MEWQGGRAPLLFSLLAQRTGIVYQEFQEHSVFELLFTHPVWAYRTGRWSFAAGWPVWVLVVLALCGCALIAFTLWRRRALGWPRLLAIGALQGALVALVLALLWRPVLQVERVRDRENVLAVVLDTSSSMAFGEQEQSRLQEAALALQSGPLDALAKVFEVRLFSFADEARPLPMLDAVPPPGPQTRIGDSLLQVLQTAGSVPLAGVILVSDGGENGDSLSEDRLAELATFGVPIHTVGVGPEKNKNDLELERVTVAQNAPQGATVTADLGIRHDGAAKTTLRVYDREKLITARELDLPANSQVTNVSVDLPAGAPGTRDLRFTLDPLPGERNVVNNTRAHVVSVPAERRSVLYIEGEPRWEYKFLRRALDGEKSLRLASVVRTTPNKYYRQGVLSAAELADGFPANAAEMFAYDAIILGSYDASSISSERHQLLLDYVDRRGGSILMLGARNGLSDGGWHNAPLAQALPVHLPNGDEKTFVQRPLQVQLTVHGAQSALARFDPDPKRNVEMWRTLPPLADYQRLGKLKPGAIVLLEAPVERNRVPLLVGQNYGRGATYILATASTMRWQMQLPPTDLRHEMFWRQLLHILADRAPSRVSLTSERTVYNDERRVELQAELRNEEFEPINDARVELLVAPERDPAFVQVMQPSGKNDGRYVATIEAPSTGLYRIDMTAQTPNAGDEAALTATTHVRREDGVLENFATQQHRAVLERIADVTGGRYWTLDQLDGLAAAIPYSKAGIVERQTLDLWNLPIVFIVLLLLKLSEWLLRLRWGRL